MIYLDYIASSPLLPEVLDAMVPFLKEEWGNPHSRYGLGKRAKAAIETARERVSALIGASPQEIYFTSSGTEASNLAIKGVAGAYARRGRYIITSAIEHPSVSNPIRTLEKQGYEVTILPVDAKGLVDLVSLDSAIRSDTILVSVMHANNEIGTVEPINRLSLIARGKGVLFHTDAVATVGVIPVDVDELGVDLLSFSAQQFYGPKGVGALYVRRGCRIFPLIEGGVQEEGRRGGTENVPGIVGMGVAAEIARHEMGERRARVIPLRDRLIRGLEERLSHIHITGHREERLPHIASLCAECVDGEAVIQVLARHGIFAASGSSCSSHARKVSPVLLAIGLPPQVAQGAVVFSLGKGTTLREIDTLLEVFPPIIERVRALSPLSDGLDLGGLKKVRRGVDK